MFLLVKLQKRLSRVQPGHARRKINRQENQTYPMNPMVLEKDPVSAFWDSAVHRQDDRPYRCPAVSYFTSQSRSSGSKLRLTNLTSLDLLKI